MSTITLFCHISHYPIKKEFDVDEKCPTNDDASL